MTKPALSLCMRGTLLATVLTAVPGTGAAQGKPAPPPPPPLNINVDDGLGTEYAIQSDGKGAYAGYQIANGVADGAYINSPGGLEIDLTSGARAMRFTLGSAVSQPLAPSYCVPNEPWTVHQLPRLAFNIVNAKGATLGIQSVGSNGVPLAVSSGGATPGYDIGAIINFLPDGADTRVSGFALQFGLAPGTTLTRTSPDTWSLEHDATDPILLQCIVPGKGKSQTTYDVGYFQVPFSLTATCTWSGSKCQ